MDPIEIAWAAGLFEGEGCVVGHYPKRAYLQIRMTDPDVLARFAAAVGDGKVYGPYPFKNPKWKPAYMWQSTKREASLRVARLLFPFMEIRRRTRMIEAFGLEELTVANV